MERLEEAERRAHEANERANRGECELEVMKIENSNQGLKYLKELKLLRKNHDTELPKLQSRKKSSADVATKRYVDLLQGKFGIICKEWKKALEEWEKKMDSKCEEGDLSLIHI